MYDFTHFLLKKIFLNANYLSIFGGSQLLFVNLQN